jgi:hypothetical protein
MPQFDPRIIQQHAQELYDRADDLVWQAAVAGAMGGGVAGFLGGVVLRNAGVAFLPPLVWAAAAALLVGYRAAVSAQREAFRLRLEAQQALCQLMIEQNTSALLKHLPEIGVRPHPVESPAGWGTVARLEAEPRR